ncbi:hypothetical protein AYI69_g7198 [Smittium culicis]|uniref:Uncharacterized protein n=1 Tax=Smittium culicis TaxID=133412 RepID=A0A1R1XTP2_9FUNG|nr:hypothetical protein AYI69_g7198 [Smittium culicis]
MGRYLAVDPQQDVVGFMRFLFFRQARIIWRCERNERFRKFGSHLFALLNPINNKHVRVFVDVPNIARVEKPVAVNRVVGCIRPVQVPLHDICPFKAQFAYLVRAKRLSELVDHFCFGVA